MDDGEVELSEHVLLSNPDSSRSFQGSASLDSFLDEFLKNTRTFTHTHACNAPGPDAAHTHTCYHTHTQVIASEEDDNPNNKEQSYLKAKRLSGNREAVRKYREKKKAHTTYLEEEVKKLRLVNQQLVRKLQGQLILEAEVLRLRSVLIDLKGKIDNELAVIPFQKQCITTTMFKEEDCGTQSTNIAISLQCKTDLPCFCPEAGSSSQASIGESGKMILSKEGYRYPAIIDSITKINHTANDDRHTMDTVETLSSAT